MRRVKSPPSPVHPNIRFVIDQLEPAGAGALMALLEERKKKLGAEGLFDQSRKQLLPFTASGGRCCDLANRRGYP